MIDYNLCTVKEHLKPILQQAGVEGLTSMNKADMVAWCQTYDSDNTPKTALDLVSDLPPLKGMRTKKARHAAVESHRRKGKQASRSKGLVVKHMRTKKQEDRDSSADEDFAQLEAATQDGDGDVQMGDAENLEHDIGAVEPAEPHKQTKVTPARTADIFPKGQEAKCKVTGVTSEEINSATNAADGYSEDHDYESWSKERLVDEILLRTGKKKLDKRLVERHQWITALQKLDRTAHANSTLTTSTLNNEYRHISTAHAGYQAPEVPKDAKTQKRKQPPIEASVPSKRQKNAVAPSWDQTRTIAVDTTRLEDDSENAATAHTPSADTANQVNDDSASGKAPVKKKLLRLSRHVLKTEHIKATSSSFQHKKKSLIVKIPIPKGYDVEKLSQQGVINSAEVGDVSASSSSYDADQGDPCLLAKQGPQMAKLGKIENKMEIKHRAEFASHDGLITLTPMSVDTKQAMPAASTNSMGGIVRSKQEAEEQTDKHWPKGRPTFKGTTSQRTPTKQVTFSATKQVTASTKEAKVTSSSGPVSFGPALDIVPSSVFQSTVTETDRFGTDMEKDQAEVGKMVDHTPKPQDTAATTNSKENQEKQGSIRKQLAPISDELQHTIRDSGRQTRSMTEGKASPSKDTTTRSSPDNLATSPTSSDAAASTEDTTIADPEDDGLEDNDSDDDDLEDDGPEDDDPEADDGFVDDKKGPPLGTHLIKHFGAKPHPKDHLIPTGRLNMFEQMQRWDLKKQAAIRAAEEAGVEYKEPPPPKKPWHWRDAYPNA